MAINISREQELWILQLLHRFGGRESYFEFFASVLRRNPEDTWPQVMRTLQETQPEWFK